MHCAASLLAFVTSGSLEAEMSCGLKSFGVLLLAMRGALTLFIFRGQPSCLLPQGPSGSDFRLRPGISSSLRGD